MATSYQKEYHRSDLIQKSLQNLADVCKEAYESGLTLEEVHFVSGAAWGDFLDSREG